MRVRCKKRSPVYVAGLISLITLAKLLILFSEIHSVLRRKTALLDQTTAHLDYKSYSNVSARFQIVETKLGSSENSVNQSIQAFDTGKLKNETDFMTKLRERMNTRSKALAEGCQKLGLSNQPPLKVKYAVLKSHNLTYCFIPKAGCTNWKKILMALNGDVTDINQIKQNIHAFVSSNYRVESFGAPGNTDGFLKLIVVRNPLDRLYSAYQDKFAWQPNGELPQFSKMSMQIHNQQTNKKGDKYLLATFEEFIKFLSSEDHSSIYGIIANHWSTYNRVCQPCSVKYDVIVHLETVEEDSRYLFNLINAPKDLKFPSGYSHSGTSATKHETALQAYRKLDPETLVNLYKAYKADFDLFGYQFLL